MLRHGLRWTLLVLLMATAIACGKKGAPEPPDPQTDQYPRQYPDPDSL
jgi:predicted small lipoprotein YifL